MGNDTLPEEFLTPADVARLAGVVPATIIFAAKAGRIPVAARTKNGMRLFRARDGQTFARERAARMVKKAALVSA